MITEVFKYRSYIQGLITENLDIMTSKKLQRKVYIKSSSEDRQADVEEKYPRTTGSFRIQKIHRTKKTDRTK